MILYLFDIDGTLLDAKGAGRAALDAVMHARHGIADASAGIRYGGKTDPAIVDEIFEARLGRRATAGERAAVLAAYVPELARRLEPAAIRVLDGAVESLAYLRGRARLGVATGNIREGADVKLAAAGLADWFELGGYGSDSHVRAELVAMAIERARATGEVTTVVVVGDTIHDIAAARACGAIACAVATGSDPAGALAHADVVLGSLRELPAWHGEAIE